MKLTELSSTFPNSFDFSDSEYDSIIKNIGQMLSISLQIQLKNLSIFLSQFQELIHSLNQSINQSKNLIQKSKEINENVFTNIKKLKENYNKEYLAMINSFENLEKKIVENYVKKNYNKNEEINSEDENSLKNCVFSAKKLEKSLMNFNKDEIRKYINDYNINLKNIKNYRDILNKNFYDFILTIIKYFIQYFNNILNEIRNDPQINNNPFLDKINDNEDIFDFKIPEKEVNSIIFELFNSKKYNINIINNRIINCFKQNDNEDDENANSKFLLSEEDIYNIVKEIYSYDFISINKSEYNLDIEKEKLKIYGLTKKLLTYNSFSSEDELITDNEIQILKNMINNNDEYILYFLSVLTQFRIKGTHEMPKKIFDAIINIFQDSLDNNGERCNFEIIVEIITLSFSFFMLDGKDRIYFGDIIKNHKIFKSKNFWYDYIINQINSDLKRRNTLERKNLKNNKIAKGNIDVILLSKILPSADTMSKFGLNKKDIISVIEPLMDKYQIKQTSKESLLSLVKKQI